MDGAGISMLVEIMPRIAKEGAREIGGGIVMCAAILTMNAVVDPAAWLVLPPVVVVGSDD
jgi:hypothetical protein